MDIVRKTYSGLSVPMIPVTWKRLRYPRKLKKRMKRNADKEGMVCVFGRNHVGWCFKNPFQPPDDIFTNLYKKKVSTNS